MCDLSFFGGGWGVGGGMLLNWFNENLHVNMNASFLSWPNEMIFEKWFPSGSFSSRLVPKLQWLLLSGGDRDLFVLVGVKGERSQWLWGQRYGGHKGGVTSKGLSEPLMLRVPLLCWQTATDPSFLHRGRENAETDEREEIRRRLFILRRRDRGIKHE